MSSVAFQMMSVAIGWQVYSITHSAYALGFVGLAQFLPMFLLTLVVGHVADRYDRRAIAYICQAIEGVGALCLCLGAWHGWTDAMPIYAIAAIAPRVRSSRRRWRRCCPISSRARSCSRRRRGPLLRIRPR